jgi:hypothetical protein
MLDVVRPARNGSAGADPASPSGLWLAHHPAPDRVPVYRAAHPQTGDVLLTRWPLEGADMGYGEAELLGYAAAWPGATGSLDPRRVDVPWASRFGRAVRLG